MGRRVAPAVARSGQHHLRGHHLLIVLAAIFAPWLGLADPYQGSMIRRLRPIGTPGYPLGTDELGRDMLSRLIYGGRLTLFIGLLPVFLAFLIGTFFGVIAGYVGGIVNQLSCAPSTSSMPSPRCCWQLRFQARLAPAFSTASSR